MPLQDFIDTIVFLFMVALRIAVPLALTLIVGRWLEKKLAPREIIQGQQTKITRFATRRNNIIQVHCWDIKRCEESQRAQCAATKRPELPCWLALQAEGEPVREQCYTCSLYKPNSNVASMR